MAKRSRKILISPSILSADFSRLGEEIREVEQAGCDMIHVDVMDGHFVPNITIGPTVIRAIRKVTSLPLDVHLMIDEPLRYVEAFREAGSDYLTVHVEGNKHVEKTLETIRKLGAKAGITSRPKTPLAKVIPYLKDVDLVLVMSVEPGFGGQEFMPEQMQKIRDLRSQFTGWISIDGGINCQTAAVAVEAGADILVAGTGIFGQKNRAEAIQTLRALG